MCVASPPLFSIHTTRHRVCPRPHSGHTAPVWVTDLQINVNWFRDDLAAQVNQTRHNPWASIRTKQLGRRSLLWPRSMVGSELSDGGPSAASWRQAAWEWASTPRTSKDSVLTASFKPTARHPDRYIETRRCFNLFDCPSDVFRWVGVIDWMSVFP